LQSKDAVLASLCKSVAYLLSFVERNAGLATQQEVGKLKNELKEDLQIWLQEVTGEELDDTTDGNQS
jgi:hypothetical protein